jgi:hypothetical protein
MCRVVISVLIAGVLIAMLPPFFTQSMHGGI